jgi:hypothetical protein
MSFTELLNFVKGFYPDPEPFDKCANDRGFEDEAHLCGDSLVFAITSNLWANFSENQSDCDQIEEALGTLQYLTEDLQDVQQGLRLFLAMKFELPHE